MFLDDETVKLIDDWGPPLLGLVLTIAILLYLNRLGVAWSSQQ